MGRTSGAQKLSSLSRTLGNLIVGDGTTFAVLALSGTDANVLTEDTAQALDMSFQTPGGGVGGAATVLSAQIQATGILLSFTMLANQLANDGERIHIQTVFSRDDGDQVGQANFGASSAQSPTITAALFNGYVERWIIRSGASAQFFETFAFAGTASATAVSAVLVDGAIDLTAAVTIEARSVAGVDARALIVTHYAAS